MAESLSTPVNVSTVRVPKIKDLSELDSISDSALCQVIWESSEILFLYARDNFVQTIEKRDFCVLKDIKQYFCDKAGEMFPNYASRTPVNRRVTSKGALALDIFNLGISIHNKRESIDMDNAYTKRPQAIPDVNNININDIDTTTQMANMLVLVNDMKTDITNMKIDVENNKKEIMSLKTDNQLMAEQLKSCKCVDKSMIIESNEIVNAIPNSLVSKPFGTATHDTVVTEPLPNNAGQSGMAADCNLLQQQGQSNQSGIESISSQSESDTNDLEEKSTKVPHKKRHTTNAV